LARGARCAACGKLIEKDRRYRWAHFENREGFPPQVWCYRHCPLCHPELENAATQAALAPAEVEAGRSQDAG
jgi:hypothetical protein